ncbi:MAG: hypothetical protein JWP09_145 [Candidatus Taylorbacteria bacterium]|nr:hypothetical protein [Candidatus Taylorbacteria bacterium]
MIKAINCDIITLNLSLLMNLSPFIDQILMRFDHEKRARLFVCFATNKEGLRSWLIGNMNELLMEVSLSSEGGPKVIIGTEQYPTLADKIIATCWPEAFKE